jgi:hypothetical protein
MTDRGWKIIAIVIFLILIAGGFLFMAENSGSPLGPCPCNYNYGLLRG